VLNVAKTLKRIEQMTKEKIVVTENATQNPAATQPPKP